MNTTHRIEIVEQEGGWWSSQIWDSNGTMIFQSHSRGEQTVQRQAEEVYFRLTGPLSLTNEPEVTVKRLGSK